MTPQKARRVLKEMGDKLPRDATRFTLGMNEIDVWVGLRSGVPVLNLRSLHGEMILLPDSTHQVGILISGLAKK